MVKYDPVWEHDESGIKGINGKNFLKFDIDCDLEWLDDEICTAMAKTDTARESSGRHPSYGSSSAPHGMYPNRPGLDKVFDPRLDQTIQKMRDEFDNPTQFRKYLTYKGYQNYVWSFLIDLKPNTSRDIEGEPWADIIDIMPYTKKIIKSLPMKNLGRVTILASNADTIVPCHRDQPATDKSKNHINFTPGGIRPIFLYDCPTKKKHFLPEDHIFHAYNISDYHGVDALPRFSYTVRVDGTYEAGIL
jgi:hypothetical protein